MRAHCPFCHEAVKATPAPLVLDKEPEPFDMRRGAVRLEDHDDWYVDEDGHAEPFRCPGSGLKI